MFEQETDPGEAAWYAARAALLDVVTEDDVDPVDLDDPGAPTDAELVAEAADSATSVSPPLLARLAIVDIASLDAVAAVDAAVSFDRTINQAHGRRLLAIATAVRRHRAVERISPERAAAAELGPALGLGTRGVDRQISDALSLTGDLTATLAAMLSGDVSYPKARVLIDETGELTTEQALAVEARVLPAAAERTYAQHAAAVRRAVVRVDPTAPQRRRQANERVARLVRVHHGDGLADLILTLPAAVADLTYTSADAWARSRKAAGDPRSLEELRAASIARWASSYLVHGDSTTCDSVCDPVPAPAENDVVPVPEAAPVPDVVPAQQDTAPRRHGRALGVGLVWTLAGLVELDDSEGELLDSGEVLSAADMRAIVARGVRLLRMLINADGELVDLTPRTWSLEPTQRGVAAPSHGEPMWIGVVVDEQTYEALRDGTADPMLRTAVSLSPKAVRDMLAAPVTADRLDADPLAPQPSAALAEFVALRDRHPANPTAGMSAAGAGDLDHARPHDRGGATIRRNLHAPSRRWHVLKTHGGWRIRKHSQGGWIWRSPHGRTYRVRPYDYRRGP